MNNTTWLKRVPLNAFEDTCTALFRVSHWMITYMHTFSLMERFVSDQISIPPEVQLSLLS